MAPLKILLLFTLSLNAQTVEEDLRRLHGTNSSPSSVEPFEPPMVTPLPSSASLVAAPWLPPSVDKVDGVVIRFSAKPRAFYYVQARATTSAKWRAVSPHLPSIAPRMGWQVTGTNVVKYYQIQEGWRVGTNFTFAAAGVATNK